MSQHENMHRTRRTEDGNQWWANEHQRATLKLQSGKQGEVTKRANKEITIGGGFFGFMQSPMLPPLPAA